MSFGLLWKNKNKPGSKFLPAKMTVLGFLLPKAGLQPAQRASCSWGASKAPGSQALVVIFLLVSECQLTTLGKDVIMGKCFTRSPGNTKKFLLMILFS